MYDIKLEKITDGWQGDVIPCLSIEEMEESVRYDIKRWDTYKMFQKQLGMAKYAMVTFENVVLLTFAMNNDEYLRVSIESDVDYKEIINNIQETLKKERYIE